MINKENFNAELKTAMIEAVDLVNDNYNSHTLELAIDEYSKKVTDDYYSIIAIPFKRELDMIFGYLELELNKTITDVTVIEVHDKYEVTITSYYPGLLIGQGGKIIDAIIEMINDNIFDKEVIIKLLDCNLWDDIYKPEYRNLYKK